MLKRISLFSIIFNIAFLGFSQDYLTLPASNPTLFPSENQKLMRQKLEVIEDNFIYLYDTLELPFIDDFSSNHFPLKITDTSDSRLTDSLIYGLFINGQVHRDTFGFTPDSTFRYLISTAGDTVNRIPNGPITIRYADINQSPLIYLDYTVFRAYNYYDTLGRSSDSIAVTPTYEQDSAVFYTVDPNPNDYYTDRFAYLNNTFGIDPPTIGVVTFDGLDDDGLAYRFTDPLTIQADYLSSVPINLSNLPDTNVYFSFFFQPKGLSVNKPERQDSLSLDFYNTTTSRWTSVWDTVGFASDSFYQAVIYVPTAFQQNGFRFRFRNYGNSSGGFDHWHIDYLYLNNNRTAALPRFSDMAYVYDAPSLLKDFYAMPYYHYKNDPSLYTADSAKTLVRNLANKQLRFTNVFKIPDTTTNTLFYRHPPPGLSNFLDAELTNLFTYPVDFEFPISKIDTAGTFESSFELTVLNNDPNIIATNDTIVSRTVLDNYYAYDDGSAEAGYGVNPDLGTDGYTAFMAVQFDIPFDDTLQGLRTYFLPQGVDITSQKFILTVWSSLSPAGIIYQKPISSVPIYSSINGFLDYSFDTAIVVPTSFYIGIKAVGRNSLNIGYDLNNNHRDKIMFSQNGFNWSPPTNGIEDGSLMLRPIFRTRVFSVGLEKEPLFDADIKVFPNPTNSILYLKNSSETKIQRLEILDLTGKLVFESKFKDQLDLSGFTKGIYFLRFIGQEGSQLTKKIIVSN